MFPEFCGVHVSRQGASQREIEIKRGKSVVRYEQGWRRNESGSGSCAAERCGLGGLSKVEPERVASASQSFSI